VDIVVEERNHEAVSGAAQRIKKEAEDALECEKARVVPFKVQIFGDFAEFDCDRSIGNRDRNVRN
jgi:hypothetical protein